LAEIIHLTVNGSETKHFEENDVYFLWLVLHDVIP